MQWVGERLIGERMGEITHHLPVNHLSYLTEEYGRWGGGGVKISECVAGKAFFVNCANSIQSILYSTVRECSKAFVIVNQFTSNKSDSLK